MSLDINYINFIKKVKWFCNCGSSFEIDNWSQSKDKNDFIKSVNSSEWEKTTLEASNRLSSFLHSNHRKLYREWNDYAIQARTFFEDELLPEIKIAMTEHGFPENVIDDLRWIVSHGIIENEYSTLLSKNQLFFRGIIDIYNKGHFPCGWDGSWPEGRPIVF